MNTIRQGVKAATAWSVHYSGLRPVLAAAGRFKAGGRRVMVVSYHRVVDDFQRQVARSIPGLLISQKTLRRQLEQAHACGYEFATLEQALEVLAGRKAAAKDLFVVTFDDAYADAFEYGAPVLKQMGVPAMMYVPVGFVGTRKRFDHDRLFHLLRLLNGHHALYAQTGMGRWLERVRRGQSTVSQVLDDFIAHHPREKLLLVIGELEKLLQNEGPHLPSSGAVMTWEQVREWIRLGFDVGAHTVHHVVLPQLSTTEQQAEISHSRHELERQTGYRVKDFAYCNGWYSPKVIELLVKEGFRSAVTTEDLPNVVQGDPYRLKRKVLWENFSLSFGNYSPALTACHLDDVFGVLKASRPVHGDASVHAQLAGEQA